MSPTEELLLVVDMYHSRGDHNHTPTQAEHAIQPNSIAKRNVPSMRDEEEK